MLRNELHSLHSQPTKSPRASPTVHVSNDHTSLDEAEKHLLQSEIDLYRRELEKKKKEDSDYLHELHSIGANLALSFSRIALSAYRIVKNTAVGEDSQLQKRFDDNWMNQYNHYRHLKENDARPTASSTPISVTLDYMKRSVDELSLLSQWSEDTSTRLQKHISHQEAIANSTPPTAALDYDPSPYMTSTKVSHEHSQGKQEVYSGNQAEDIRQSIPFTDNRHSQTGQSSQMKQNSSGHDKNLMNGDNHVEVDNRVDNRGIKDEHQGHTHKRPNMNNISRSNIDQQHHNNEFSYHGVEDVASHGVKSSRESYKIEAAGTSTAFNQNQPRHVNEGQQHLSNKSRDSSGSVHSHRSLVSQLSHPTYVENTTPDNTSGSIPSDDNVRQINSRPSEDTGRQISSRQETTKLNHQSNKQSLNSAVGTEESVRSQRSKNSQSNHHKSPQKMTRRITTPSADRSHHAQFSQVQTDPSISSDMSPTQSRNQRYLSPYPHPESVENLQPHLLPQHHALHSPSVDPSVSPSQAQQQGDPRVQILQEGAIVFTRIDSLRKEVVTQENLWHGLRSSPLFCTVRGIQSCIVVLE
jgi:hypothetical protein